MSEQRRRRTAAAAAERERPVLAVVGRPNVGKSTLVNRLVGRQEAIVEERPGVTVDRKSLDGDWQGRIFTVVDTGGWMPGGSGSALDDKVSLQSEQAMGSADAVLLVVDGRVGLTEDDARVAGVLRRIDAPVFVVVNKIDHATREQDAWEFLSLGLGEPYPLSALHGTGTGDLLDAVLDAVGASSTGLPEDVSDPWSDDDPDAVDDDPSRAEFSVAIVGRPNVGKSTLFNRLIGEERSVVHDMPGTTRDAIDTVVDTEHGPIRFVDTAGMRRRSRIGHDDADRTEYYSMVRALRAVDRADVAFLVVDATEGVTHQDQRLAERVDAAGCPVVILLNKWELVEAEERERRARESGERLRFLGDAPMLRISARSGKGVHKLLPSLGETISHYRARIPTGTVNRIIRDAQVAHPAPGGARVLYATQGATNPPTFTLFANRDLPATYLRYLERALREGCDLGATPVKIRVRRRS